MSDLNSNSTLYSVSNKESKCKPTKLSSLVSVDPIDCTIYQVDYDLIGNMTEEEVKDYIIQLHSDPSHTIEIAGIDILTT